MNNTFLKRNMVGGLGSYRISHRIPSKSHNKRLKMLKRLEKNVLDDILCLKM
jgi:hypothetical protein